MPQVPSLCVLRPTGRETRGGTRVEGTHVLGRVIAHRWIEGSCVGENPPARTWRVLQR